MCICVGSSVRVGVSVCVCVYFVSKSFGLCPNEETRLVNYQKTISISNVLKSIVRCLDKVVFLKIVIDSHLIKY